MQKLLILKVVFLILFILFTPKVKAAELILPKPKPTVDQEVKKEIVKKKSIYPQKKPTDKDKSEETTDSEKISEISEDAIEESIIYPKKKPLTVQKQVKKVARKSKILSKKDFAIAKSTFKAIEKNKWKTALKLSKKARNKILYDFVNYLYLKKKI